MIKCALLSSSAVHRGIELWYCGVERYRMLCECSSESLVLAEICLVMYCPSNEALALFPDFRIIGVYAIFLQERWITNAIHSDYRIESLDATDVIVTLNWRLYFRYLSQS